VHFGKFGLQGGRSRRALRRFMITCRIPVEKANELAKTGRLDATIHSIMEELNPEAAYFSQQIAMTVRRVS
jgi:hypothetical protein